MQSVSFLVQSSSEELYNVVFSQSNGSISATCTCQAGFMGQYCKHRLSILGGSAAAIAGDNGADVSVVLSWLPGSKLAQVMASLAEAEVEFEKAKKHVAALKKQLAAAMRP